MTDGAYPDPIADGSQPDDPDSWPLRAEVTLVFEIRAHQPLEMTDAQLSDMVSDRLGRVLDNGPYPTRDGGQDFVFGATSWGKVDRGDGTAPPLGYHCGQCLDPRQPDAPCPKPVRIGSRDLPCILRAGHHENCRVDLATLRRAAGG